MTLPDIDTLDTYGGALADYSPLVDPTTDRKAVNENKAFANVAGMTQTLVRAWRSFVGHATTPADPASNVHGAVWGNDVSLKPGVVHTSTGVYTITWATTVDDELDETHSVNLRRAKGYAEGSTPYHVQVTMTSPNVAVARVWDMAGVLNDAVGATITVETL